MVLVSVVMNAYNHEKYISEAIESILNQSFNDFELIIIDDFSIDSTAQLIRNYQLKDSRIRAFYHEKNMGIAKTMNQCISEAKGKFIAFISSDDVWSTSKLEKQLKILKENQNLLVWSEGEIIDAKSIPTGNYFTKMHLASQRKKSGNILAELIEDNFIFGQSLIMKTEYAKQVKYNDQLKYLNDYKFMVDLASQHEFFYISEPLAKYRVHGKNSIFRDEKDWLKDRIILRNYFSAKIRK
jgi:glycosyltransferase involved in cell wall biosynthesis